MIDITRVKLSELNALVSSPEYAKWAVIPISRHRAKSYINNPRASDNDMVLYLAYIDNELVGYRTILSDTIFKNGEAIKVGWLSGNWVNPKLRRKGIATALFEAAFSDWDERLLFTNYALESKAVYDKTSRFHLIKTLEGRRFYLRPCLAKTLPPKGKLFSTLSPAWFILDQILRILNPLPLLGKMMRIKGITVEYLPYPDEEVRDIFTNELANTPTARAGNDLEWILSHPWLVSSPLGDRIGNKYYFSSSPKRFESFLLKVYRQNQLLGIIMINSRDGFATTPYVICNVNEDKLFAKIIAKQALAMGCNRLTTFNLPIANALSSIFPFGLLSKSQERNFYASQKAVSIIEKEVTFLEGDGDCAFV